MTAWGRARLALVALAVVAILFLFVFPTRAYLHDRAEVSSAQHDVDVLRQQNDKLEAEAWQLQQRATIERMARDDFHMVYPGEHAYNVMPANTTTTVP